MSFAFDPTDRRAISVVLDDVLPGCVELGALDYIETLLGALDHDPPHIWAAPVDHDDNWLELGPWERHAWAKRINNWRHVYQRIATNTATQSDLTVAYHHACEATYGDPAYGGNNGEAAWQRIGFPAPLFPPKRTQSNGGNP